MLVAGKDRTINPDLERVVCQTSQQPQGRVPDASHSSTFPDRRKLRLSSKKLHRTPWRKYYDNKYCRKCEVFCGRRRGRWTLTP
jgi:hypothetical protein